MNKPLRHFGAMKRGFTLVELLVVLLILVILAGIAVQSLEGVEDQTRYQATQRGMQNIEDALIDGQIARGAPVDQAPPEIFQVELAAVEQRSEQGQRQRPIIRPGAGWHAGMGAPKTRRGRKLNVWGRGQITRIMEFIGHAQRVANEQAQQAAL